MATSTDLLQIARSFVKALQNRTSPEDLLAFYHPEIEQVEYPNTLTPSLTRRNLPQLKKASEKGKSVLVSEEYDIINAYVHGNTVILETIWTGTLAVPLGKIPPGGQMKAYFAQFIEFVDDKIIRIRNYDCFEPFT